MNAFHFPVRAMGALALAAFLSSCNGCTAPGAQCAVDDDCNDAVKNRCVDNVCVQCVSHADCPSGACRVDGTCAACVTDAQCPAGTRCGPNGDCEVGCSDTNGSCPSGKVCLPGTQRCVDCTLDSQCGPGRVCSPQNTCVPGCSPTQPLCPQGQVCNQVTGQCVQCTADAQCPAATPICDPTSSTCVRCLQDAQCPLGQVCANKACVPGCSASHGCPGGQQCDLASGQCVQCLNDAQCPTGAPRCDPASHTCKACLPGATDNCPVGEYCRADFVCERGCKRGSDCPSGVCLGDHSCQACTTDAQCAAGKVCNNGTCVNGCSAQNPCGGGKQCCAQHCVDYQTDVNNCGACGNVCGAGQGCCAGQCRPLNTQQNCGACGTACITGQACCSGSCQSITTPAQCGACGITCAPGQFCDGATCRTPTFPEFCANSRVYVIYDGIANDNAAANVLASTIVQNCSPQTVVTYSNQTDPTLVDQATGAPLIAAPATLVLAGGPYPSKVVKWLELTQKVTKVYFASNGTTEYYFKRRSDGSVASSLLQALCSPHRDQFLVELVTDPASGNLALIGYGLCSGSYGTQAAGWFYSQVLLPNRASYPDSWYVFDWTDTNNDSVPNAGDTFTKVSSGL